jgi:hypothetical protein
MKTPRVNFCVALALFVSPLAAQTGEVKHRFIQVNGIKMHIAEQGSGPLVVLVHGFPELWYSWRHVLPALAEAGYHAVAPDMRGYGQSDVPRDIVDYSQLQVVGDIVGLVHALGYRQAVIAARLGSVNRSQLRHFATGSVSRGCAVECSLRGARRRRG